MTDDFDDSECFQVGLTYRIVPRVPSSPGIPRGLALDRNGTHFGWVKDHSRVPIEAHVLAGRRVECTVTSRGKRWEKYDYRLEIDREWQEGLANCIVYSGTSPALETSLELETPTSSAPGRLTTVGADDEETTSEVETASGNTSETASEAETIDK